MSLLFIVFGLAIGILAGFFGIGGGFILTPVLMLFGFSPVTAIGTSLMYSIGTSLSGVWVHLRLNNIIWQIAAILSTSGIAATQIAHPFVKWLEKNQYDDNVIPALYVVIIAYFAYSMLKKDKKRITEGSGTGEVSLPKTIFIGFGGGFLSATLGVGGGFVMVPLLISLIGLPSRKAVGTSLVSVFFIVAAGFTTYALSDPVDYGLGLLLIIGALIGGQLGAKLTVLYQNKQIKLYFGLLYIVTLLGVLLKMAHFELVGLLLMSSYMLFLFFRFTRDSILHSAKKKASVSE
jgi:uncharacterized membrane protein YfcA